ncbi:MAG: bifunctional UDP-N-acetylmuramoyl-tripeptide:D-alanyl-D-alanine ligase/alanine racemase [Bacteroidota bacterium]
MTNFSQLPTITGGTVLQYITERPIGPLLLDSRKLPLDPNGLFFAMKGQHHDSHQFIPTVYEQGIRQFVVEQGDEATYQHLPEANIIQVASSINALQQLATHHRSQYQLPLLAITGSNGKTIVKEWLSQLLALKYTVVKSPKSYNSQIGVPLSIWLINATHEYGIFEAGISLPGEMARLATILQPTAGIFTNIGPAHDEGFATRQQKLQEKALLFKDCQKIYYCLDHAPIHQVLTTHYDDKAMLVTWSWHQLAATYQVQKQLLPTANQTELTITTQRQSHTFILPFQDDVSIENAVHCIIFLLHEGLAPSLLQPALLKLRAVPMRLTLKQGVNGCQIIDDTYNNDLVGLQIALDFMDQQKQAAKKTVILSDLLQTGVAPDQLYPQVAQLLQDKQVDRLIGIGEEISAHAAAFIALDTQFYKHTASLLQAETQHQVNNELILVKGARPFGLERIVDQLQQKIHSTVLEVDLSAVAHNLNFFRSKLTPGTKLMAMVKASAYGSSSFEIPHLLQYHRVDYLAVAYPDEGVSLREHGITCPIMVMNPTPESFEQLIAHDLEPEIYSLKLLRALADFLKTSSKQANIHLKLETGMHRLGFVADEFNTLIQLLQETPALQVVGIMSHLAASGEYEHDHYTHQQFNLFAKLADQLEQALGIHTIKHLLNSSGILRFPNYQLDMVRLGIGLYGVGVDQDVQPQLQVANTLRTVVSQLKTVPPGATIGYSRQGRAQKSMQIATLAIGYADGFSRALGNGNGSVWIKGQLAPTVGNICMDMCMVDVTDISVAEGDEAIIFGPERPIVEVAAALNTIPYEVLTNVSERVKRVYYTS